MPMGEYKNFADCEAKNKSKDDPGAYCGYIKNQIEGSGKKKEEALSNRYEHEAFHLEEDVKGLGLEGGETNYQLGNEPKHPASEITEANDSAPKGGAYGEEDCPVCHGSGKQESITDIGQGYAPVCSTCGSPRVFKNVCQDCGATQGKGEEARPDTREKHLAKRFKVRNVEDLYGAPESEIMDKAEARFIADLTATVKLVTLMAKDTGYHDVSEKTSPTKPKMIQEVKQQMADVVIKQAKGFGVEVNWFNTVLDELQDITKSANKFFTEAGWNNKDTVKEYQKHMKENGRDWMD